ncbi:hypothetical protein MTR67_036122 [Solanum verrucosum]|uniref:Copia protein n=1 Tax=Solanum verrucosum TaxID=315347 RepID=A0AAF0ZKW6_SOLVR|nr:hypothetical protein MTR67_036122 [Solanum verrucosum]
MLECKPTDTPMETNHKLGNSAGEKIKDVGRYQRLVGKLIYLTHTRSYITYVRSKKQKVVARSSAEEEFRGMANGLCELLWIKNVLKDLGIECTGPMNLFCDNKAAIQIAQNPVQQTKHVEIDRHFIKDKLDQKIIHFPFVKSENQLADVLTKVISGKVFHEMIGKLGMIDIYAPP